MGSHEFFEDIEKEKSAQECENSVTICFEGFWQDVYEGDREHSPCSECEESIESTRRYLLEGIEEHPWKCYQEEEKERQKHMK